LLTTQWFFESVDIIVDKRLVFIRVNTNVDNLPQIGDDRCRARRRRCRQSQTETKKPP